MRPLESPRVPEPGKRRSGRPPPLSRTRPKTTEMGGPERGTPLALSTGMGVVTGAVMKRLFFAFPLFLGACSAAEEPPGDVPASTASAASDSELAQAWLGTYASPTGALLVIDRPRVEDGRDRFHVQLDIDGTHMHTLWDAYDVEEGAFSAGTYHSILHVTREPDGRLKATWTYNPWPLTGKDDPTTGTAWFRKRP